MRVYIGFEDEAAKTGVPLAIHCNVLKKHMEYFCILKIQIQASCSFYKNSDIED